MPLFLIVLSITLAQVPGIVIRYFPYSNLVTPEKKKRLFVYYGLCFILQNLILYFFIRNSYSNFSPLTYKRLLFLLSTTYVFINVIIIKGNVFKHMFIYGMQGGFSIFIHSIVAIFLGFFSNRIPLYLQFAIQTSAYIILFTLLFILLWEKIRHSNVFNSTITDDYYWNIIWLIPALVIYSDAMVTMNSHWLNNAPQIVSRMLSAFCLVIAWKCICLDFDSLEHSVYLKSLNKVLHFQAEGITAQAHILMESENHIKIYKHDMRHNLDILNTLIQEDKTSEALDYIKSLDSNLITINPIIYCHNIIINSTFLVYMSKAHENDIKIQTDLSIPDNLPWNSNDIAILIANSFENAIIASSKQDPNKKEISVSVKFLDNKLAILIKNRFDGEVLIGKDGFPITNNPGHGIGMQSILSIVNRYKAFASCSNKDGWFNMTFLFTENT